MIDIDDCLRSALGAGVDPAGTPWAELDPPLLHERRTSIKWARHGADVLPLFVAEMDFTVAPQVRRAITRAVDNSDLGYVNSPGALPEVFAAFAEDRWGWSPAHQHVHLATDVATGGVEALRVLCPAGGRLVLPVPTYPGFFEMLQELPFEVAQVPLHEPADSQLTALDLTAIEREFAGGARTIILCNPHNPHGVPFTRDELTALAELAATYDVCVLSDEIHAPLTHHDAVFTPFAPLAAAAVALSATVTSASKGWNIAGAKCSVIVAADERANEVLQHLPPEVITRVSLLGLHANIAAFGEAQEWLDRAITQVEANQRLFASLLAEHLPQVQWRPGQAGYLAWLDFRETGVGDDPAGRILADARVALNPGHDFGDGGRGHARRNLACAPATLVRAVERIATVVAGAQR